MKPPRACQQCRRSKRRCTRSRLGEPCDWCQQRGLDCGAGLGIHAVRRQRLTTSPASSEERQPCASVEPEGSADLPWETTEVLVQHYLAKVHDRLHSVFHEPTLWTQLRNGAMSRALLWAICAIGSKFTADPGLRAMEAGLTAGAKRLLLADLESACLENIQACILVAALSAGNRQTSSEAIFIRVATSMAEIMNLNSSNVGGSVVARETARRCWWSLYVADHWCFSGLGIHRGMEELGGTCALPMDETTFRSLSPDQATLRVPWRPGLWAYMVMLVRISGPIQFLNRRIARGDTDTDEAVQHIEQRLEAWAETLPADTQMAVQNLNNHQRKGLGGLFVALHLSYHHYSTLLYFRFLEDRHASSHRVYIDRCKRHALSFSGLLHLSRQTKACEVNCPIISQMIAVSSSVLVHTLLFGDLEELQKARQELDANFEALIELQPCWPSTSATIDRLTAFQNMCLLSTESHKLDGWMVRFLLEHSRALDERELLSNIDLETESMWAKAQELRELGRYTDFEPL